MAKEIKSNGTYRIRKRFDFEAAHSLPQVPEGHKCRNLHGHSYKVDVFVSSTELDEHGFVIDFGELKEFKKKFIDFPDGLDHRTLNNFFSNPTAEIIAKFLFDSITVLYEDHKNIKIEKVRVWETDKAWGEYEA